MLGVVAGWMGDHSQKATLAENYIAWKE